MEIHDLIIIWSWPAWHTAAIYAARANLAPLMFEGFYAWWVAAWWQLTTTTHVENFPWFVSILWSDLMQHMRDQSIHTGTTILTQTVESVDLSVYPYIINSWEQYGARSIIIATWATAKKLDIPWVDEFWNKWISWCAVCDGALPIFRNQVVVVIGWWDVAMEEAMHVTKFASQVMLLVRSDKLKASKAMQDRVISNPKISIMRNTQAISVSWDTQLRSVTVQTWQDTQDIQIGWLFFAIGHIPNTAFLDWQLEMDDVWYIKATNTCTSIPWVFAAWDVADRVYRQAITSAWSWCMAALEAEKFLSLQEPQNK